MSRLLITGHRGAPSEAPENTRSSFSAAIASGAQVIETDIRLCADAHIVISHDDNFARLGGPGRSIRKMTRSEIEAIRLVSGPTGPERPLFMDEALMLFPDIRFNVDLKDSGPAIVREWAGLLRRSTAWNRCITASFYDRSLRMFRRIEPDLPVSVARFGIAWILLLSAFGTSRRPKAGEGVLQIPEKSGFLKLVSPRTIGIWHRFGWKVEVWTIDNREDMERLYEWGVDGIITNRPSLLKEFLHGTYPGENP